MNITTSVIAEAEANVTKLYGDSSDARSESLRMMEHRNEVRNAVLDSGATMCPSSDVNLFKRNSSVVDMNKVKEAVEEQFSDAGSMKAASCAVGAAYYSLPTGLLSLSDTVNEYITNPRQIGSESAYGYAVLGGVSGVPDMIIAKGPRSGEGKDLEHEMFVAMAGTNRMRSLGVPNFALVYGGFRCSRAVIDSESKKVVNWCSNSVSGEVPYAVYENVAPSVSAHEYALNASAVRIMRMYMQFLTAISVAHEAVGFTHYDAHNENVLMRDVSAIFPDSNVFQIRYPVGGKEVFVTADSVVTLIDYGMSVIKYDGEFVGAPNAMTERNLYYTDRAYPLHDAYKFLMFTLKTLKTRRDKEGVNAFVALSRVFRFFNAKEAVSDVIEKQWRFRYSLPYTKEKNVTDLMMYIRKQFPSISSIMSTSRNKNVPLLDCRTCWTFEKASREFGINGQGIPTDLVSYYDLSKTESYGRIKTLFDYGKARKDFTGKLSSMPVSDNELRLITRMSLNELLQVSGVAKMKKWRTAVFRALYSIDRTRMYLRVADFFVRERNDAGLAALATQVSSRLEGLNSVFCRSLKVLKENLGEVRHMKNLWYSSQDASDVLLIKAAETCHNVNSKEDSSELFVISDQGDSLFPSSRTLTMDERRGVILN